MNVIQFITTVARPYLAYICIPILNAIIYATVLVGGPIMLKALVNAAHTGDMSLLIYYACCYMLCDFLLGTSYRFTDWALLKYEPALRNNITQVIFKQLALQSHRFFQNNFGGALSAKLGDLVSTVPSMISTIINGFLLNILLIVIAIGTMFAVSSWISIALIVWAALFISVSLITIKKFSFLAYHSAQAGSQVMASCVDAITNMLGVRLFSRYREEAKIIGVTQKKYLAASQRRRWFTLKLNLAQTVSFWLYQLICLSLLITLRTKNQVTPGDFAFILTINVTLIHNLWHLSEKMRDFSDHWGQAAQALETFYAPLEVQDVAGATMLDASSGEIKFDHVRFTYPGGESLFQNKSITIPAGQKVGLVGFSGGGKSTFVNLILRLYDIDSGHIFIDGQDIAQVTQESLREAIAVVPQEPSLFHRSVKENIRYGSAKTSDEEVIKAAKQAAAHDFIMKLPNQYETTVGERGAKLSGGQRQRVALARALIKNAPILILDEATSQLDTITEKTIQLSLAQWFENHHHKQQQTTLVIAHRLSTLLHMDRILVFDKGKIVQDGTHAELLAQEGLYQTLWNTQIEGRLPY